MHAAQQQTCQRRRHHRQRGVWFSEPARHFTPANFGQRDRFLATALVASTVLETARPGAQYDRAMGTAGEPPHSITTRRRPNLAIADVSLESNKLPGGRDDST